MWYNLLLRCWMCSKCDKPLDERFHKVASLVERMTVADPMQMRDLILELDTVADTLHDLSNPDPDVLHQHNGDCRFCGR